MTDDARPEDYETLVLPVLLAEARRTHTHAIREALAAAGFDDMPRAGVRVIGRIARGGTTVSEVAQAYGVSKQAASQLVDALVARDYVERVPDEEDRRRMNVALTERGKAAAVEVRASIDDVDGRLVEAVGAYEQWRMRQVLGRLAAIKHGPVPRLDPEPAPDGARPEYPHGKVCYLELPADDVHAASVFYAEVFGWSVRRRGDGEIAFDDAAGGVSGTWVTGRPPERAPNLIVHIMVDSVANALEEIVARGGAVVEPIGAHLPEITARFADPYGNVLGLYQHGPA